MLLQIVRAAMVSPFAASSSACFSRSSINSFLSVVSFFLAKTKTGLNPVPQHYSLHGEGLKARYCILAKSGKQNKFPRHSFFHFCLTI